jgi:hypothetical protein
MRGALRLCCTEPVLSFSKCVGQVARDSDLIKKAEDAALLEIARHDLALGVRLHDMSLGFGSLKAGDAGKATGTALHGDPGPLLAARGLAFHQRRFVRIMQLGRSRITTMLFQIVARFDDVIRQRVDHGMVQVRAHDNS